MVGYPHHNQRLIDAVKCKVHKLVQVIANPPAIKGMKSFILQRLIPLLEEFYDDVWEQFNLTNPTNQPESYQMLDSINGTIQFVREYFEVNGIEFILKDAQLSI